MAQLKENSTVTKNAVQNKIWHDNYNTIISSQVRPITGLSDDFSQRYKIQASDTELDDKFGLTVACSNTRIVVGANGEDTTASDAGAAYIFDLNGNELHKIQASDAEASDNFGSSIACSNNRIVVGAYQEDSTASGAGSAYIFDLNGNELAKIQASDAELNDYFGYSVAVSDTRIVVGAPYEDTNGLGAGKVYIYDLHGNEIAKIQASDAEADDWFGYSVACSNNRIVVGANGEDTTASDAGAAYIFDLNGNELHKIQASDAQAYDEFGSSVAISNTRIVVGAYFENSAAGSIYIFDLNGNELHKIQASDAELNDKFGYSVACSDTRIVVGARYEDTTGVNAGSAYIFDLNGNELAKIQASDAEAGDEFGYSVTVSDTRIVVGAPYEDSTASNAGSVYIFNNFRNDITEISSTVYKHTGIEFNV